MMHRRWVRRQDQVMPLALIEWVPLPTFKTYAALSIVTLSAALYYADTVVSNSIKEHNDTKSEIYESESPFQSDLLNLSTQSSQNTSYATAMAQVLTQDFWCTWTVVNMAYFSLIVLGKLIQKIVFGSLRVSEQQHIKDKCWNFVFYKFIFVFGVINVQNLDDIAKWVAWFTIIGFLHLFAQLCKDRFEYVSFSPTTSSFTHIRVLSLLIVIQSCASLLIAFSVFVGLNSSFNNFAFMVAECLLLAIKTLYVITKYAIHLYDLRRAGVWEQRSTFVYYTDLMFELVALGVDFLHHMHMLLWGNVFLSMASLVICMQLRYLFHECQRRIRRHKNYLRVVGIMNQRFPMATPEDLRENNDDCAICWEGMESARKLPCRHLFHNACLRSWLEQDTSCPTCRQSLSESSPRDPTVEAAQVEHVAAVNNEAAGEVMQEPTVNHFYFDGSRYVNWLPSFSIEVTTNLLGRARHATPLATSQLDHMARDVLEVFPLFSHDVVVSDLRQTHSVEVTIDNILNGRLTMRRVTPPYTDSSGTSGDEDQSSSEESSSVTSHLMYHQLGGPSVTTVNNNPATSSTNTEGTSRGDGDAPSSRFSKSPSEREAMLASRGQQLIEAARRRFLDRTEASSDDEEHQRPMTSQGSPSRRELAYRAAQRRLNRD